MTNAIIVSRDVVVDEEAAWNGNGDESTSSNSSTQYELSELIPNIDPSENVVNEEHNVTVDIAGVVPPAMSVSQRSQRVRQPSSRLNDYALFPDNEVTEEGDLVHFSLYVEVE